MNTISQQQIMDFHSKCTPRYQALDYNILGQQLLIGHLQHRSKSILIIFFLIIKIQRPLFIFFIYIIFKV
jgi:hypothetical protein